MTLYDFMYLIPREEYNSLKSSVRRTGQIKNHIQIGEGGRVIINKPQDDIRNQAQYADVNNNNNNTSSSYTNTPTPVEIPSRPPQYTSPSARVFGIPQKTSEPKKQNINAGVQTESTQTKSTETQVNNPSPFLVAREYESPQLQDESTQSEYIPPSKDFGTQAYIPPPSNDFGTQAYIPPQSKDFGMQASVTPSTDVAMQTIPPQVIPPIDYQSQYKDNKAIEFETDTSRRAITSDAPKQLTNEEVKEIFDKLDDIRDEESPSRILKRRYRNDEDENLNLKGLKKLYFQQRINKQKDLRRNHELRQRMLNRIPPNHQYEDAQFEMLPLRYDSGQCPPENQACRNENVMKAIEYKASGDSPFEDAKVSKTTIDLPKVEKIIKNKLKKLNPSVKLQRNKKLDEASIKQTILNHSSPSIKLDRNKELDEAALKQSILNQTTAPTVKIDRNKLLDEAALKQSILNQTTAPTVKIDRNKLLDEVALKQSILEQIPPTVRLEWDKELDEAALKQAILNQPQPSVELERNANIEEMIAKRVLENAQSAKIKKSIKSRLQTLLGKRRREEDEEDEYDSAKIGRYTNIDTSKRPRFSIFT